MRRIPFFKMSGSGNDFILVDNRRGVVNGHDPRELARAVCRRKLSVGADGIILIEKDPEVDFQWRFFNSDGSDAEMCGNGARCAARFAMLNDIVANGRMRFRTLAGIIEAEVTGSRAKVQVTTPLGLGTNIALPLKEGELKVHFVNTGVPHVVHFVASEEVLEGLDVTAAGKRLRWHERFQPAGTNANFVFVRDPGHLVVRTFERGVEDETLACGTGCCAAALIAGSLGFVESPVEVLTRGGETLTIYFAPGESGAHVIHLEGDARVVYEGTLWPDTIAP